MEESLLDTVFTPNAEHTFHRMGQSTPGYEGIPFCQLHCINYNEPILTYVGSEKSMFQTANN